MTWAACYFRYVSLHSCHMSLVYIHTNPIHSCTIYGEWSWSVMGIHLRRRTGGRSLASHPPCHRHRIPASGSATCGAPEATCGEDQGAARRGGDGSKILKNGQNLLSPEWDWRGFIQKWYHQSSNCSEASAHIVAFTKICIFCVGSMWCWCAYWQW